MSPSQINRFFKVLARQLQEPATIILTGAAAGSLLGRVRPSADIDFAVIPSRKTATAWESIEAAIRRTEQLTNIQAQYAEDIDRWSSISLLDYQRHTRPYRRFGSLDVRLMDPPYWAIGKLSRFLPQDRDDLLAVLKRQRPPAISTIALWARAIRESPRSPALTQCRDHIEYFLRESGRAIWGTSFDPEQTIARFRSALRPRRNDN